MFGSFFPSRVSSPRLCPSPRTPDALFFSRPMGTSLLACVHSPPGRALPVFSFARCDERGYRGRPSLRKAWCSASFILTCASRFSRLGIDPFPALRRWRPAVFSSRTKFFFFTSYRLIQTVFHTISRETLPHDRPMLLPPFASTKGLALLPPPTLCAEWHRAPSQPSRARPRREKRPFSP